MNYQVQKAEKATPAPMFSSTWVALYVLLRDNWNQRQESWIIKN